MIPNDENMTLGVKLQSKWVDKEVLHRQELVLVVMGGTFNRRLTLKNCLEEYSVIRLFGVVEIPLGMRVILKKVASATVLLKRYVTDLSFVVSYF